MRHARGERVGAHEDVTASVSGDEAEPLLGVIPLDLARWHVPNLALPNCLTAMTLQYTGRVSCKHTSARSETRDTEALQPTGVCLIRSVSGRSTRLTLLRARVR